MLQFKAAILQATSASQAKPSVPSRLEPDAFTAPQVDPISAAPNKVLKLKKQRLGPKLNKPPSQTNSPLSTSGPPPPTVPSPALVEALAPPLQHENKSGEPLSSLQFSQQQSKSARCPDAPASQAEAPLVQIPAIQVLAAQDEASHMSKMPQPITFPLVRSKTGRIILPSSMKPRKIISLFHFRCAALERN